MTTETKEDRLEKRLKGVCAAKAEGSSFGLRTNAGPKDKKRRRDRTPSFRVGRVIYSGRNEIACIIKDYSDEGAKIVLETEFTLPPEVRLCISQSGVRRPAKVVWQKDREAGLAFAPAAR